MLTQPATTLLILAGSAIAKICINQTVPVTISARTGIFNLPVPQTNFDATAFVQNQTRQGGNLTEKALIGYKTTAGTYNISTQFCTPSTSNGATTAVQILTHGIGFDKTYWDQSYSDFKYSYVNVATDTYKYSTLAYDRLGIGNSSHGEPLNEIQSFLEVAALAELTLMLRNGKFPKVNQGFKKVTHVGHSFGSAQTYSLVSMYPTISDGIVLTGFSMNGSFVGLFGAGADFQQANLNQPFRFGSASSFAAIQTVLNNYGLTDVGAGITAAPGLNYPNGYLTNSNANSNQYLFFLPGYFDEGILFAGEAAKQPVAVGELLTLTSLPAVNEYARPVLIITGSDDLPYCGGDCLNTGNPSLASIPAAAQKNFPKVLPKNFETYIQPNTGHGLNSHYNATGGYDVINKFLNEKLAASSSSR